MSKVKRKRTADVQVPRASRPSKTIVDDRIRALAKTCRKARREVFEADRRAWEPDTQGPLELAALGKIRTASTLLEEAADLLDDLATRPKI